MVIHFMHAGGDGKVTGIAILLKAGSANATIQQIWEHMPKSESKEQEIAGVEINPANLLPRDFAYYTYMGSLTAPPVPGRIGKICDFWLPFFRFGLCPPFTERKSGRTAKDEISNP